MRYSKVLKLGAVGLALLLIPRRSSRQSERETPSQPNSNKQPTQQADDNTAGKETDENLSK